MRWLWIDRFTEFRPGEGAVAIKAVTSSEEHVHEHSPGAPSLAPCLMIEGMAQTGGIVVAEALGFARKVVLAKVVRFECRSLARPGDLIEYAAEVRDLRNEGAMISAVARRQGETIAEAEIMFAALAVEDRAATSSSSYARELTELLGLEAARVVAPA